MTSNGSIINRRYAEEDPLLLHEHDRLKTNDREGNASFFASFGLIWVIITIQAIIRWVISDDFGPPPVQGPDVMETWRYVCLRIFEALSMAVFIVHVWFCILLPMYPGLRWFKLTGERGNFSLDGRHVLGGCFAFWTDGLLNSQRYLFMFNANAVNIGVWSRFLPFHNHNTSSRYSESLLWGMPMYIYFCAGFGIIGCQFARRIRNRFPTLTNAGIFTIVWCIEFVLDFCIENIAIRVTRAYGFALTYGPLTLWPGEWYQFPIYESACVAILGCLFTAMRLKACDSGLSPVERGYHHWPAALQPYVRTMAVIGFSSMACIVCYHVPVNLFALMGDSHAEMPSYMSAVWE